MDKETNISIVIPVYNEADSIEHLLQEIYSALNQQVNYEIIVVDDGSTDSTYTHLKNIQNTLAELVIVRHHRNAGQSTALVSGAKQARYEWLVTLDGDGQNNPHDILKLIQICKENSHSTKPVAILGNRIKRQDDWLKRVSSRIANTVRKSILKDHCPDTNCSLKMFPTQLFLNIPHFNHLHRYMPALFLRNGATIINVPVDHRPRMKGVSKYGLHNRLWVGIVDMFGVFWLLKRPCQVEVTRESK